MRNKKFFTGLLLCLLSSFYHAEGAISESSLGNSSVETTLRSKCKNKKYDYIIVGNGTAGAVLARKLSDNKKNRILVLEAGVNNDSDPIIQNPDFNANFNALGYDPKYSLAYPDAVQGIFNNNSGANEIVDITIGRGWGGSSMHNYMTTVRGTPEIYNNWATASGDQRWSYNNLLNLMKSIETYTSNGSPIDTSQRGTSGPLYVTQSANVSGDPWAIAQGEGFNVPFVIDYNDPTQGILGYSSGQWFNTPGFTARSYSISAFLPIGTIINADGMGLDGRKLKIISKANTNRVLFNGNKAIGVEYSVNKNSKQKIVKVYGKKIILSAGAINSPAILERSGIGDPAVLEPLGIKVLVNSPNVGNNLVNQYGPAVLVSGGLQPSADILYGTLPLFWDGNPTYADGVRRYQIYQLDPQIGPNFQVYTGAILAPQSRGSIHIVNTDPYVYPRVILGMYTDNGGDPSVPLSDANLAVTFYREFAANVLPKLGGTLLFPPAAYFADPTGEALLGAALSYDGLFLLDHPNSTLRMGTNITNGVVDSKLRVFGTKNLYVADNSITPLINNGNTAWTAYVIGAELAEILTK